jgi:5-formyltetrahydrofolate cyclo-ligase
VTESTDTKKRAIRERVWALLEREHVTEPGVRGYIPAFSGSDKAAALLATLEQWRMAQVIKAVPDRAQAPVRERALRDGKLVYMPIPRLAENPPFCVLDPAQLSAADAATWQQAVTAAPRISIAQMRPVDMVVCGSVAVNRSGVRLGKGAGYSDIEVALLTEAGLITAKTVIVTTVHPLQVLDETIPEKPHDFSVDLIITTDEVIPCSPGQRPVSLDWDEMPADKIAAIPILAAEWQDGPESRRYR